MIPQNTTEIKELIFTVQPSLTYHMNESREEVRGELDGKQALHQAVQKILQTQRYAYLIYDWDYGIELQDLFGRNYSYVIPEIQKRIEDALLYDDRISALENFSFETNGNELTVKFEVNSKYGFLEEEMVVTI